MEIKRRIIQAASGVVLILNKAMTNYDIKMESLLSEEQKNLSELDVEFKASSILFHRKLIKGGDTS